MHPISPAPAASPTPPERSQRRLVMLAAATAANTITAFAYIWVGVLAPLLLIDWLPATSYIGYLGSAYYVGAVLFAVPGGRLSDGAKTSVYLILALILQGLALLAVAALRPSLPLTIAFLATAGAGYSVVLSATSKLVALAFPPGQLGMAIAIKQTGITAGGALAAVVLTALASRWGWRWAVGATGSALLAMAAVIGLLRRAVAPAAALAAAPAAAPPGQARKGTGKALLRDGNVWAIGLAGLLLAAGQQVMNSFGTVYFTRYQGRSIAAAGVLMAVYLGASSVGRILWAVVADRLTHGDFPKVLLGLGISTTAVTVLLSLLRSDQSLVGVVAIVAVFGVVMGWNGVYYALLASLHGVEHAGSATGVGLGMAMVGATLFPPVVGLVLDAGMGFPFVWRITALVLALGTVILLTSRRWQQRSARSGEAGASGRGQSSQL